MSDDDFEPRPDDYLVEPMFAPFEPRDEADPEPSPEDPPPAAGWWAAVLRLLGRR